MADENITLTPQEREELVDDIKWRTSTTIYLKTLTQRFDKHEKTSNGFRNDVTTLKTHRTLQWFFLAGIILSILGLPFWLIK